MSKEYPCVYFDHEKCTLHGTEPEYIDWCVMGPCSKETPSNADHIRSLSDEELAKFLLEIMSNSVCFGEGMFPYHPCPQDQDCEKCGLGWLREPYKEDT